MGENLRYPPTRLHALLGNLSSVRHQHHQAVVADSKSLHGRKSSAGGQFDCKRQGRWQHRRLAPRQRGPGDEAGALILSVSLALGLSLSLSHQPWGRAGCVRLQLRPDWNMRLRATARRLLGCAVCLRLRHSGDSRRQPGFSWESEEWTDHPDMPQTSSWHIATSAARAQL